MAQQNSHTYQLYMVWSFKWNGIQWLKWKILDAYTTKYDNLFYIFTLEIRKNGIHGEDISSACNYIEAGNTSVLRPARVPPEVCVTTPLAIISCKVNGASGPAGKSTKGSGSAAFTIMLMIKNARNITHKIIMLL